jgi:hypothetical protein
MGLILGAHCNCGFAVRFDFGSNLIDFSENCLACSSEVAYYNDPSLQLEPAMNGNKFAISWLVNADKGRFILPPTHYKCPDCGNMRMKFVNRGCWED